MKKNALEWAVFAFSFLLILAVLSVLIMDALNTNGNQPQLRARLGPSEHYEGHYRVPVIVDNRGNESAEGVHVEVTLTLPSGEEETADFELLFVPRESERQGWVGFTSDPSDGSLEVKILGYQRP